LPAAESREAAGEEFAWGIVVDSISVAVGADSAFESAPAKPPAGLTPPAPPVYSADGRSVLLVDSEPVLLSRQEVVARIPGHVIVQALVGEDGLVRDVRIAQSDPRLDADALEAVRGYVFLPALLNWKPVPRWTAVWVPFIRP